MARLSPLALGLLLGCSADPRPQLVLVVDTDAAAVGQLSDASEIAPDAAIDMLRVDFLAKGEIYASNTFSAPDPRDWPLSFGVVTPEGETPPSLRIRLRAFRADLAETELSGEQSELLPRGEVSIDRLLEVELPSEGIARRRVTLTLACLGVPTDYLNDRTCVTEPSPNGEPLDAGLIDDPGSPTRVGTTPLAPVLPCRGSQPAPRICIPGGLTFLGDPLLVGFEADVLLADSVPLQPVYLSPFWIDRTEVTVAELRALASELGEPLPLLHDPGDVQRKSCTWLGENVADNDLLPVNCISAATAAEVCRLRGGQLPSEAQWEHAATGRGEHRAFPWGNTDVGCCGAALGISVPCGGNGLPPAGSHSDGCDGPVDVSRDGVLDLGGSVSEVLRDEFSPYGDPNGCWAADGIVADALCIGDGSTRSSRGSDWAAGLATPRGALRRRTSGPSPAVGFRCAYEDQDG